MRFGTGLVMLLITLCLLPVASQAQVDKIGAPDTIFADIAKLDAHHWTITVSYFNDEIVLGLSVPFKMTAGLNRIVADSAVFTDGRTDHFNMKLFRADTAIQCVLLGLVGPGLNRKVLTPGKGRIATIFVSSLEGKPIEKLNVDTTTVHPENSLLAYADAVQGMGTDTTRVVEADRNIVPVFVVRRE